MRDSPFGSLLKRLGMAIAALVPILALVALLAFASPATPVGDSDGANATVKDSIGQVTEVSYDTVQSDGIVSSVSAVADNANAATADIDAIAKVRGSVFSTPIDSEASAITDADEKDSTTQTSATQPLRPSTRTSPSRPMRLLPLTLTV